MEYLKLFSTENDYIGYRDSSDYLKPNVSLSDDKGSVYYNYPPPPDFNGHDYVDLGLPSGTKWAAQNVGARKPYDSGLYFQWGDISGYTADQLGTGDGKKTFEFGYYKWNPSGDGKTFTKYTQAEQVLDLEDDAAHVNMGGDWRMPTLAQIQELINTANTTSALTTQNGVSGTTFTSKKDTSKSIFIPASGYITGVTLKDSNNKGYTWTSVLSDYRVSGRILYLLSTGPKTDRFGRYNGLTIRGVIGQIK